MENNNLRFIISMQAKLTNLKTSDPKKYLPRLWQSACKLLIWFLIEPHIKAFDKKTVKC